MTVFEKVFFALNKTNVKYLVIGGVAVNLHGYVRFTGDLDLLLLLNKENLARIDKVMKRLKYSERLPVSIKELGDIKKVQRWIKEKNLKAYTFNPPPGNLLQIDIIINESLKFAQFYKRKLIKTMGKLKIPVVSINDIIEMKKRAKRDKDIMDLKVLKYFSEI